MLQLIVMVLMVMAVFAAVGRSATPPAKRASLREMTPVGVVDDIVMGWKLLAARTRSVHDRAADDAPFSRHKRPSEDE